MAERTAQLRLPTAQQMLQCLSLPPMTSSSVVFNSGSFSGVIGHVEDRYESLTSEERSIVSEAVSKRKREFSTGRYLAKQALLEMGITTRSILHTDRRPVWPKGIVGSISHSMQLAVAVVTHQVLVSGIGIDLEQHFRVPGNLHEKILTSSEIKQLGSWEREFLDPATLLFSAKESVYKAVSPIVGKMIDYVEADIHLDADRMLFEAQYVGKDSDNTIMNSGVGRFISYEDHFVCVFVIPN